MTSVQPQSAIETIEDVGDFTRFSASNQQIVLPRPTVVNEPPRPSQAQPTQTDAPLKKANDEKVVAAKPNANANDKTSAGTLDAPGDPDIRVLVTGASGYIAGHIIKVLLERGYRVRGTVRNLKRERDYKHLKQITNADRNLEFAEADLVKPASWPLVMEGVQYVIHTASPFVIGEVKDENDLIKPAVDGTLNVLRACARTKGGVKRVILTSSEVAIAKGHSADFEKDHVFDERDWSNDKNCPPYPKSKTLAERAAWAFVKELKDTEKFDLVVINPTFVQGPVLSRKPCASNTLIKRFLTKEIPGVPHVGAYVVDVRDVAIAHVRAIVAPNAPGKRYLCTGGFAWFTDYAEWLTKEFSHKGYDITTMKAPYPILWIVALFDKQARAILDDVDKRPRYNVSAAERELGMQWISPKKSIVDHAYSLIEFGVVRNLLPMPKNRGDEKAQIAYKGVRWVPDDSAAACMKCTVDFSVTTRRHHCRACGKLFCADCSKNTIDGDRVCDTCYDLEK